MVGFLSIYIIYNGLGTVYIAIVPLLQLAQSYAYQEQLGGGKVSQTSDVSTSVGREDTRQNWPSISL